MPIYEFECDNCNKIFEDWCKHVADGEVEHYCPECKSTAHRIISHTSFALKGTGWYATEYGTMKKKAEPASSSDAGNKTEPAKVASGSEVPSAPSSTGAAAPSTSSTSAAS